MSPGSQENVWYLLKVFFIAKCMCARGMCYGTHEGYRGQIYSLRSRRPPVHGFPGLASDCEVCMAESSHGAVTPDLPFFLGLSSLKIGDEVCLFVDLFSGWVLFCSPS